MKSFFALATLRAAAAEYCRSYCPINLHQDPDTCECVPFPYDECSPMYNLDCNQYEYDVQAGRDPNLNPSKNE